MKKRKVYSGEVHHIIQRTRNSGVIFYTVQDYLVFFTIYCSQALQKNVNVLSLCPIFVLHLHLFLGVVVAVGRIDKRNHVQCYLCGKGLDYRLLSLCQRGQAG